MRLVLIMALAVAGCSAAEASPEAQCERQAMQDPAVQAIYSRSNGYYTVSGTQQEADLAQAKRQAVMRCTRAKGLAPPGGVQPIAPR